MPEHLRNNIQCINHQLASIVTLHFETGDDYVEPAYKHIASSRNKSLYGVM